MKIKLSEIVNACTAPEGGQSQFNTLLAKDLPIKISYRLKRLADALNPILKTYDEKRNELIKEYGDEYETEKGEKAIKVSDPKKLKLFSEKFTELVSTEEEINFDRIKISELNINISAKDLPDFIFEE
jgi:hypothetical protein